MISEESKREKLDSIVELRDSLEKFRSAWLVSAPTVEDTISLSMIVLAYESNPDRVSATMCLATVLMRYIEETLAVLAEAPMTEEE